MHKKNCSYRRMGVLFVFFCALLLCLGQSAKAEVTGNTVVTYEKTESDQYGLTVIVKGDGKVTCQKDEIRDGKMKYQLAVDEALTFRLKPDLGAEIKTVKLNGEDLNSAKDNQVITVKGAEKEQELTVEFSDGIKTRLTQTVKTGDATRLGVYIVLLVLGAGIIAWIVKSKRNKREEAKEDGEEQDETFSK